ncbi:hypothetical protein HDU98_011401, partial [Podochytrium sp. JEL0797]
NNRRVVDCMAFGDISFLGSFETTGGVNGVQMTATGIEGHWNLLCGFKDGNIGGWTVCLTENNPDADETDEQGISINKVTVSATGSLCSLGDWITWLDEDEIADVVIAGAWDGRIRVWDKRKRALRRSLISDMRSAVLCLKIVGEALIAGSYNGSLVVYDFSKDK